MASVLRKTTKISLEVVSSSDILALPQLREVAAGSPAQRPGFNPKSGQLEFLVARVALAQVSSE
jgi:hypothetical protein